MWTILKVFIGFVTILLLFYIVCVCVGVCVCVFGCEACGILTPQPGTEPIDRPPTSPLEGEVLTNGLQGKSLSCFYKLCPLLP